LVNNGLKTNKKRNFEKFFAIIKKTPIQNKIAIKFKKNTNEPA